MSDYKIDKVTNIIRDTGGSIVGRTRLQKIAYLLTATGLDDSFWFTYKHYGPFSDQLASSAEIGALIGPFSEAQDQTAWGGTCSTYTLDDAEGVNHEGPRYQLGSMAAEAESIELELAATAVFLFHDGYENVWEETAQRKPAKFSPERLANAKALLANLATVDVPNPIPAQLYQ